MKTCIHCGNSYPESFYYKREKGLRAECKKCFSDSRKRFYNNNRDKVQSRIKDYYLSHKESVNAYKSAWQRKNSERRRIRLNERYRTEPNFRVAVNLRCRVLKAINNKQKKGSTLKLLGCSIDFFVKYLESRFLDGMSWENHGTVWHIDHKRPCSSFDLSRKSEQSKCFHYTNMQPLYAQDNLAKGSKYG